MIHYIDTYAKFHDHQSNNNKFMVGALMPLPCHDPQFKKAHVKQGLGPPQSAEIISTSEFSI